MNIKQIVEEDFKKMSELSLEEYVLYKKWYEINSREWTPTERQRIIEIKDQIWVPEHPMDYENLEPILVNADTDYWRKTWLILRIFISTMYWNQNPGRIKKFVVINKEDNKFLGVISIASDFIMVGGREKKIGWTMDDRIKNKMVGHTANGSSIVPTQPLGFNYVGGKLLALLTTSDYVEKTWDKSYKNKLVGLTTTSLYGGYSQYSRLKYWQKCESTTGKIPLEPSEECYQHIRNWAKKNHLDKVRSFDGKSRPKMKLLNFIYKELKIRPPVNNFPRGVYWCPLYNETNKFLRREVKEVKERRFDNSVKSLAQVWKDKYALKRIKSLLKSGRNNNDVLYYDNMIDTNWQESREKYITQVGR